MQIVHDQIMANGQSTEFPYYVKALAMGIPAILIGLQVSGWIFIMPAIVHGHSDFRQLYTAGYVLRAGQRHALYDYEAQVAFQNSMVGQEPVALPFNHLAYEALVFLPLSYLPYRAAFLAFLLTNLLLLWLSYRLLGPQLDRLASIYRLLPAVMFISFLPVAATLMQGQDSIILLALTSGMTYRLSRKRELSAGILLGLGCFKFQIVVPVALLFLIARRWRMAAGFAVSAILTALISVWLVGRDQFLQYSRSLLSMSTHSTSFDRLKYGIDPIHMPNLRGLVFGLFASRLPQFWIQLITFTASAALFSWVAAGLYSKRQEADLVSPCISTAMALSYHLYIHDLSVVLIPVLLIANRFADGESSSIPAKRWALRLSAAMFAAPAFMSFIPTRFYLVCLPLIGFIWIVRRSVEV